MRAFCDWCKRVTEFAALEFEPHAHQCTNCNLQQIRWNKKQAATHLAARERKKQGEFSWTPNT